MTLSSKLGVAGSSPAGIAKLIACSRVSARTWSQAIRDTVPCGTSSGPLRSALMLRRTSSDRGELLEGLGSDFAGSIHASGILRGSICGIW